MDREVSKIDTEDFISEVEKSPAIWDSRCDAYSDKLAKLNAWVAVITTFFKYFEEMTPPEKKTLGNIFQRRWKSLRDSYSREIAKRKTEQKSGSAASSRKGYLYFEQLTFLQPVGKSTKNSIGDSGDTGEGTNDDDPVEVVEIERPVPSRKRAQKRDKEDELLMQTLKSQYLQRILEANDEDRLFMLSLVPEIKKIPDHMKLDLKARLLSVFSAARNEMIRQQSQVQQFDFNFQSQQHHSYTTRRSGQYANQVGFQIHPSDVGAQFPTPAIANRFGAPLGQVPVPVTIAPQYHTRMTPQTIVTPTPSPGETMTSATSSPSEIDFSE